MVAACGDSGEQIPNRARVWLLCGGRRPDPWAGPIGNRPQVRNLPYRSAWLLRFSSDEFDLLEGFGLLVQFCLAGGKFIERQDVGQDIGVFLTGQAAGGI